MLKSAIISFESILFIQLNNSSALFLKNRLLEINFVILISHATNYKDSALIIIENSNDANFVNEFYNNLDDKVNAFRNIILNWKDQLLKNKLIIPNLFSK